MTITQTPQTTAADYAEMWSRMNMWITREMTEEAGDEHPLPEDEPVDDDEPSYDPEWDEDDYGILRYRVTRSY